MDMVRRLWKIKNLVALPFLIGRESLRKDTRFGHAFANVEPERSSLLGGLFRGIPQVADVSREIRRENVAKGFSHSLSIKRILIGFYQTIRKDRRNLG